MDADHWVYLVHGAGGQVLYVGMTGEGVRRLHAHRRESRWARFVARIEVEHHPSRLAALERERDLIGALNPPYNVAGSRIDDGRLSSDEAAEYVNLPKATMRAAIRRGDVEAEKTARGWRVTFAALEAWIDRCRRENKVQPRGAR